MYVGLEHIVTYNCSHIGEGDGWGSMSSHVNAQQLSTRARQAGTCQIPELGMRSRHDTEVAATRPTCLQRVRRYQQAVPVVWNPTHFLHSPLADWAENRPPCWCQHIATHPVNLPSFSPCDKLHDVPWRADTQLLHQKVNNRPHVLLRI